MKLEKVFGIASILAVCVSSLGFLSNPVQAQGNSRYALAFLPQPNVEHCIGEKIILYGRYWEIKGSSATTSNENAPVDPLAPLVPDVQDPLAPLVPEKGDVDALAPLVPDSSNQDPLAPLTSVRIAFSSTLGTVSPPSVQYATNPSGSFFVTYTATQAGTAIIKATITSNLPGEKAVRPAQATIKATDQCKYQFDLNIPIQLIGMDEKVIISTVYSMDALGILKPVDQKMPQSLVNDLGDKLVMRGRVTISEPCRINNPELTPRSTVIRVNAAPSANENFLQVLITKEAMSMSNGWSITCKNYTFGALDVWAGSTIAAIINSSTPDQTWITASCPVEGGGCQIESTSWMGFWNELIAGAEVNGSANPRLRLTKIRGD